MPELTETEREADRQAALARAGGMDFGPALVALKNGHRVTREGWDNPGMWLVLVPGSTFAVSGDRPVGLAAPELVGCEVDYQPHIDLYSGGVLRPWTAPHADLVANDWRIA